MYKRQISQAFRNPIYYVETNARLQVTTTKGTGGDIIVLEEAAYVDPGFFYETVAPLMIVGTTTLIGISTLTSEINFYTRLIRLKDKSTGLPLFSVMQIELACAKCREDGKAIDCVHLLHLVPRWQSSERHRKLKVNLKYIIKFNLSIIIYFKFDEYITMNNY